MSTSHEQHINIGEGAGVNPEQPHGTAAIWKTFWILLALTLVDIGLYFIMPPSGWRNGLFIILGLIKAYYIVGVFMHMKYERVNLIMTIILPILFVLGLIMGLLYEANFWHNIGINID